MSKPPHWKDEPDRHDFPAAKDYLSLVEQPNVAEAIVQRLRRADTEHRKAKDILRASSLPLLPIDNVHVKKDLTRIRRGTMLSPVLLVRGRPGKPLIIADGYHRVCASYHVDENADVPCRIAG